MHHLPCKLSHDGPAKVSAYFTPEAADGARACTRPARPTRTPSRPPFVVRTGKLTAYFRGRQLEGHIVKLPPGVVGFVAHETVATSAMTPAKSSAAAALEEEDDDSQDGDAGAFGGFADFDEEEFEEDKRGGGGRGAAPGGREDAPSGFVRNWVVEGRFESATQWLRDRPPGEGDVLPSALEWVAAARALHALITREDFDVLGR